MRILCENEEETFHREEIAEKIGSVLTDYSFVVVPWFKMKKEYDAFAAEKFKKRYYAPENHDRLCYEQRLRHHAVRIRKNQENGLITDLKNFEKLIHNLANNIVLHWNSIQTDKIENFKFEILKEFRNSISGFTDNRNTSEKLVENMWNFVNNSKLKSINQREIVMEVTKTVLNTLKDITKRKDKELDKCL